MPHEVAFDSRTQGALEIVLDQLGHLLASLVGQGLCGGFARWHRHTPQLAECPSCAASFPRRNSRAR
jgi:hypothetical protein